MIAGVAVGVGGTEHRGGPTHAEQGHIKQDVSNKRSSSKTPVENVSQPTK